MYQITNIVGRIIPPTKSSTLNSFHIYKIALLYFTLGFTGAVEHRLRKQIKRLPMIERYPVIKPNTK